MLEQIVSGQERKEKERKLRECSPIPLGWLYILIILITAAAGIYSISIFLQPLVALLPPRHHGGVYIAWIIYLFCVYLLWMYRGVGVSTRYQYYKDLKEFISDYIKKNLKGMRIEYFFDPKNTLRSHIYSHNIDIERGAPGLNIRDGYSILYPLGGWFRRPWICKEGRILSYHVMKLSKGPYSEWCVPDVVMKEIGKKMSIRLTMDKALEFVSLTSTIIRRRNAVEFLIDSFLVVREDRDRLMGLMETIMLEKEEISVRDIKLRDILHDTISKIEGTKRFIKSKQAEEIRDWVKEKLQEVERVIQ